MDKETALNIVKQYAEVVKQHFPVKKIVMFGSYARGFAQEDSDIDVAIVTGPLEGDFLDRAAELYRLRGDIDLRIEPILFSSTRDLSGFLAEVIRTGEVVYSSE